MGSGQKTIDLAEAQVDGQWFSVHRTKDMRPNALGNVLVLEKFPRLVSTRDAQHEIAESVAIHAQPAIKVQFLFIQLPTDDVVALQHRTKGKR